MGIQKTTGWLAAVLGVVALSLVPGEARAQGGEGFLYRQPVFNLTVRGGWAFLLGPRSADPGVPTTDFYGEQQRLLTLGENDFDAFAWSVEGAFRLAPRLDLTLEGGRESSFVQSEDRNFVEDNDLPIVQTTRVTRRPFALGLRYFLTDRGRRISRFAWIPNSFAPYLSAGAGLLSYTVEQDGDFVDYTDLSIFRDRFRSTGTTATFVAAAGFQYSLAEHFLLMGEGRYRFASGGIDEDYVGYDDLNLSGLQLNVGLGFRF